MKDIKGYEGLYAITSCGRVWSYRSKKFLIPQDNGRGYKCVKLYINGKEKSFLVHRLVAEAYIPNLDNLPEVDHKDNNRGNNVVNNLQWITRPDNVKKQSNVRKIRCVETGIVYDSTREAERQTGIGHECLSRAARKNGTSHGYHWEYIGE